MSAFREAGNQTLAQAWRWSCSRHGQQPFLLSTAQLRSYYQTDDESTKLAAALLRMGVGKGSKVAIWMPNGPEWVIALLAITRIGGVAVPLSTFYQAPELAWALQHNDVHTLLMASRYLKHDYVERVTLAVPGLAEQTCLPLYLAEFPFLRHLVVWGAHGLLWAHDPADLHAHADGAAAGELRDVVAAAEDHVVASDDCIIINTSGSTARPKAVVHTHQSTISASAQMAENLDLLPEDRTYTGYPFFWIAGLNMTLLPTIYAGAAMVFSTSPKPENALQVVNELNVTRLVLPPAQFDSFFNIAGPADLGGIRKLKGHAYKDWLTAFQANRGQSFGMTESFGMHSMEPQGVVISEEKATAMGRGLAGIERIIRDPVSGQVLPAGQVGELYLRGINMMRGYYKMTRSEVFDEDGFFRTGDRGMLDADGFFWFDGRANELIKSVGANVSPREVELALEECEGISNAYVFSVPDKALGEAVTAVVVVSDGAQVGASDLRRQLSTRISSYKIPVNYYRLNPDDLPGGAPWKSARELVDKRKLREKILAGEGVALPA